MCLWGKKRHMGNLISRLTEMQARCNSGVYQFSSDVYDSYLYQPLAWHVRTAAWYWPYKRLRSYCNEVSVKWFQSIIEVLHWMCEGARCYIQPRFFYRNDDKHTETSILASAILELPNADRGKREEFQKSSKNERLFCALNPISRADRYTGWVRAIDFENNSMK